MELSALTRNVSDSLGLEAAWCSRFPWQPSGCSCGSVALVPHPGLIPQHVPVKEYTAFSCSLRSSSRCWERTAKPTSRSHWEKGGEIRNVKPCVPEWRNTPHLVCCFKINILEKNPYPAQHQQLQLENTKALSAPRFYHGQIITSSLHSPGSS